MKKNIIITAGPTNERIDSVMKITNMSTGSLGACVANTLLSLYGDDIGKLYYLSPLLAKKPNKPVHTDPADSGQLECIQIESAEDLLAELTRLLTTERIDAVVHSAAVGDYKAAYSVRAEDMAKEILYLSASNQLDMARLMNLFENPACAADDSGKMSSYEPHLMTMLTMTPKVIGSIKKLSPETMLIGFKLLDGVPREELIAVATRLREKNNADYIIANDLSNIRNGEHIGIPVSAEGPGPELHGKNTIAGFIAGVIFREKILPDESGRDA